jgi:hypothetical protein
MQMLGDGHKLAQLSDIWQFNTHKVLKSHTNCNFVKFPRRLASYVSAQMHRAWSRVWLLTGDDDD